MVNFVKAGDFCPNEDCPDHSKLQSDQQKNINKFGKTKAGKQRFLCKTCEQTFTETKGTIFYRRRTPEKEIIETLAFIAEGDRISSISRVKGHKEDTILSWIRDAANHAEAIEELLMKNHQIKRGQIDGLWSYVGHKGAKKNTPKARVKAPSGVRP